MRAFAKHLLGDYEPTAFVLGGSYEVPSKGWIVYTYEVAPPRTACALRLLKGATFPSIHGERAIAAVETYAVGDETKTSKVGFAVQVNSADERFAKADALCEKPGLKPEDP